MLALVLTDTKRIIPKSITLCSKVTVSTANPWNGKSVTFFRGG